MRINNKTEKQRLQEANELLATIAGCGRNFFGYNGRVARLEVRKGGKIWLLDEWTETWIYTHHLGRWKYFSHGATLKSFVCGLRRYIKQGCQFPGDFTTYWGYDDESVKKVLDKAQELGITTSN